MAFVLWLSLYINSTQLTVVSRLSPLQYSSTVSMAHFRSLFQRILADPVHSVSSGCQPCHKYTSIRLSSMNKAEETKVCGYWPGSAAFNVWLLQFTQYSFVYFHWSIHSWSTDHTSGPFITTLAATSHKKREHKTHKKTTEITKQ